MAHPSRSVARQLRQLLALILGVATLALLIVGGVIAYRRASSEYECPCPNGLPPLKVRVSPPPQDLKALCDTLCGTPSPAPGTETTTAQ